MTMEIDNECSAFLTYEFYEEFRQKASNYLRYTSMWPQENIDLVMKAVDDVYCNEKLGRITMVAVQHGNDESIEIYKSPDYTDRSHFPSVCPENGCIFILGIKPESSLWGKFKRYVLLININEFKDAIRETFFYDFYGRHHKLGPKPPLPITETAEFTSEFFKKWWEKNEKRIRELVEEPSK